MMQRKALAVVGSLVLGGLLLGGISRSEAAVVRGNPIQIANLDDAGATVNDQMHLGVGRVAAMGVGFLGALAFIFGYIAPGLLAAGGGFGSALMPGAISGTFDAAPAADGLLAPLSPWLSVLHGFLGDRLQGDIVFFVALAVALWTLSVYRHRQQTRAAL